MPFYKKENSVDSGYLKIKFRLSDIGFLKKQRAASLFLAAFGFDREHRLAEEVVLLGKELAGVQP